MKTTWDNELGVNSDTEDSNYITLADIFTIILCFFVLMVSFKVYSLTKSGHLEVDSTVKGMPAIDAENQPTLLFTLNISASDFLDYKSKEKVFHISDSVINNTNLVVIRPCQVGFKKYHVAVGSVIDTLSGMLDNFGVKADKLKVLLESSYCMVDNSNKPDLVAVVDFY
jgi:hypothetical protein